MARGGREKQDQATRNRLVAAALLAAACPLLAMLFSQPSLQAILFPGYRRLSELLMSALATATSVAPFAIWDWLTAGLVVAAFTTLVRRIRRMLPWFSVVALVVAATALLGTAGWALNHYAPELSQDLGLEVGQYSEDQLADATSYYLNQAASRAQLVPREEDGTLSHQDFYELARIAGASYAPLSSSRFCSLASPCSTAATRESSGPQPRSRACPFTPRSPSSPSRCATRPRTGWA